MTRRALLGVAVLACACGRGSQSDGTYVLPAEARDLDVRLVSSSDDGRFVLLGQSLDDRGVLIIDRQTREVRWEADSRILAPGTDLVRHLDASVRSVATGAAFDFPAGTFDRPVVYKRAGDWLVRLGGLSDQATIAAVSSTGRSWSRSVPVKLGSRVRDMDASGLTDHIALTVDGPANSDGDTELLFLNLADGSEARRAAFPNLGEGTLVYAKDGPRLLLSVRLKLSLIDSTTGGLIASGGSVYSGGPVYLRRLRFWSFMYTFTDQATHFSPAKPRARCTYVAGRIEGERIEAVNLDTDGLAKHLGFRAEEDRCPVRGVVPSDDGPDAVLFDPKRRRVTFRPLR